MTTPASCQNHNRVRRGILDITVNGKPIKAIAQAHKDEWKALGDRARTAHEALNDAITADTINDGAIRQKSAEVAAVDAANALDALR